MRRERRIWCHWQNLSKCDHCKRGWPIEGRAWLYVFAWTFRIEWHLWGRRLAVGFDMGKSGDDTVLAHIAIPPVSLWFGIEAPSESWLYRLAPEQTREFKAYFYEWAFWLTPWGREHEWRAKDPWWIRGITIHFDDLLLGKCKCSHAEVRPRERIVIRLDGREYHGEAAFERRVWKRPRWVSKYRESTWISMDVGHGLPHAGKGESGYDCGDDALCGWGVNGFSVERCIESGIEKVGEYRRKYGMASCAVA